MGLSNPQYHGNVTFLMLLLVTVHLTCCQGNNVGYKHLQLSRDEILVDQIVPLEDEDVEVDELLENLNDKGKDEHTLDLYDIIENLRKELLEMKRSQTQDREALVLLEKKVEGNHKQTIISNAEVVQIRQLVSENFHNIQTLDDTARDQSVYLESVEIFQKETNRDLRRFRDYKEKAAKRFHQLENHVEKLHKYDKEVFNRFNNVTQEIKSLTTKQLQLRDITSSINDTVNQSINLTSSCCLSHDSSQTNQGRGYSETISRSHDQQSTNQHGGYSHSKSNSGILKSKVSNEIEIIDFGSGETSDDYLSHFEEETNTLNKDVHSNTRVHADGRDKAEAEGSGETVYNSEEGSGELGSGALDRDELIPVVDLSRFMEVTAFQDEIMTRDNTIQALLAQNQNLTAKMLTLEERLSSIQVGSFMRSLQDSLINFTQNVITLDQWKVSSTQMVNSTLNNQDQIFKLTNMILENADKLKDLKWEISNTELVGDQQFRILRMHVVRLNNTVEDIKEQLNLKMGTTNTNRRPGYQPSYYGYQRSYYPSSGATGETTGEDPTTGTDQHSLESLMAKLDELGLQIVYNQNRLGNLEVKVLNETLYQCRKQNIDLHQDERIAKLETLMDSTTKSLSLIHRFVRDLDKVVKELDDSVRVAYRRLRTNYANIGTLKQLAPIIVGLRSDVQNFLFYLPSDCQEYSERGYSQSGVYIIHPIRAAKSSQVTCHFDQSGGWTVLQQRFNGIQDFNMNWTAYREGFGNASSEYWIGNDVIYLLTSSKNYSLRVDMTDTDGNQWQANYKRFHVSLPNDKSTLSLSGFHGNISDSLSYANNMGFSTTDKDNDASSTNCAYFYAAGWWYKHCQNSNLNGRYPIGFLWFNMETSQWLQLTASTMKIIPT